jgi:hypothetical protein
MFLLCSACWNESISKLFVKIGRTVDKLFKGVFYREIPAFLPKMKCGKFFMFPCVFSCRAESIGILFMGIG